MRPPEIISKEAGFRANADGDPNADVSCDHSSEDFGAASYRTPGNKSNKKARYEGELDAGCPQVDNRGSIQASHVSVVLHESVR
ncbi:hypothetical protein ACHAXM_002523 [Skeletonema potamos]